MGLPSVLSPYRPGSPILEFTPSGDAPALGIFPILTSCHSPYHAPTGQAAADIRPDFIGGSRMNDPASRTPLAVGTAIGDHVITGALDHDGQGFRYRARHRRHGPCVLHEFFPLAFAQRLDGSLQPRDPEDRTALRWWTRNYLDRAQQFAALRHPALLPMLDVFEAGGGAWYASAEPKGTRLEQLFELGAPLERARLQPLLSDLVEALAATADAGLLHRAVCPQQIWVGRDGHAVLSGFGSLRIAIRLKTRTVTSTLADPFAAPEEHLTGATLSPSTDLYALAAIAYRAASGVFPPPVEARARGVALPPLAPLAADRLGGAALATIERALALDPRERPPRADAWRAALRRTSTPSTAAEGPSTSAPQRRHWLRATAAAGVVLAAGAYALMLNPGQALRLRTDVLTKASQAYAQRDDRATARDAAPAPTVSRPQAAPAAPPSDRSVAAPQRPAARAVPDAPSAAAAQPAPRSRSPEAMPATAAEPAGTQQHASQLALERSRCRRHISEYVAGRNLTYADVAASADAVVLQDGRLQTPPLRTDDNRLVSFLITRNGCVVRATG